MSVQVEEARRGERRIGRGQGRRHERPDGLAQRGRDGVGAGDAGH